MKKILLASVLSAAFVSPAVFAQAKNFEGFGIQLSTGYQNNESKYSDGKIDGSRTVIDENTRQTGLLGATNGNSGGMPLNLGIGYTAALNNNFTLGLLVEFNPLSMDSGSSNLTVGGQNVSGARFKSKLENQVSVSLVPGYAFTNETMGYAKVGWINASAKLSPNEGGGNLSVNTNGYILGLGVKQLFTKNIYGFAEANYVGYSATTGTSTATDGTKLSFTNTPTSYSFLVGVGYKF
jgi:opacity protein-like surface antigen